LVDSVAFGDICTYFYQIQSTAMKNYLPFVSIMLIAAIPVLSACSKDKATPITLTGNWGLVKDSVVSIGSAGNVPPDTVVNIYDKTGDYYNFSTNGQLYMQVDGFRDTATYVVQQNNQLSINYREPYNQTITTLYSINDLSAHSVVLINPGQFLAPFLTKETIHLSR
jgi:secreted trypsin-like serine protease